MKRAEHFLAEYGIPVIAEIDTRALVRHLRDRGVMRGVLAVGEHAHEELFERPAKLPSMAGLDPCVTRLHALELSLDRRCRTGFRLRQVCPGTGR